MTRETTPAVERAARAAVAADPHLADVVIGGKVGAHAWETIPELGQENYRVMVQAALTAALDVEELTEVLARHQWNMLPLVVAREMSPWDDDRVSRSALAQTFRDRARPFAEAVRRSIVGA